MRKELKKAIIDFIFENLDEFQITNFVIEQFRPYIYDGKGAYLLGGEEVATFIEKSIDLIKY